MAGAFPRIQHLLLRAQASGEDPAATLDAAIDAWEQVAADGGDRGAATALAALRHLLLTSCPPAAALAAIARTSAHPAALGMLLAELLARGVVPAGDLLAAVSPSAGEANLLAAAVAQLHAAAIACTLPSAAAAAAAGAFDSLVKLLVTAGHPRDGCSASTAGQGQQRAAERALAQLRREWLGTQTADQRQLLPLPGGDGWGGAGLLAALVDAADREAFPRESATSWIAAELRHVLQAAPNGSSGSALVQECSEQGWAGAAAAAGGGEGTAWQAAMAAFAAALPTDTLVQQVQAAACEGRLAVPRAAALLAAAAAQRPRERPVVARWLHDQASTALAQRSACTLHSLLLLQRELLLAAPPESGGGGRGGSRRQGQQAHHKQQVPPQGQAAWYPAQLRQGPHGQPLPAEQRYCAWLADTLLGGPAGSAAGAAASDACSGAQQHLQFLVQQVLVPLCPEDPPAWLTAQRDTLSLLLAKQGEAAQRGLPPLQAGGRQAADEYIRLAEQRLRALQAQQAQQAEQQGDGPAAAPTNLQKGQAIAKLLIQEWVDGRGQLLERTIQTMLAKAANVFTRGELHNMLAPALLEPSSDGEASEQRAAFMEYLYEELDSRKDTHIKQHFRPEAVQLYRRRCLQAQLEGASLEQLARRAPQLLLADSVGSAGSGFSGTSGSISGHQLLDRVARLVGEQLARWSQAQQGPQQAQQRLGSARSVAAGPERLAGVLLGMWTAAYTAGMVGGARPDVGGEAAHPAAAALAAHMLSIVHSLPLLHGPLLRRLAEVLLGEDGCDTATAEPAQQQGQFTARERLAAAAMLASTAGAIVRPDALQAQPGGSRRGPQAAGTCLAALRPLFVWRVPPAAGSPAGSPSGGSSGASDGPLEVPGPVWLQQLLEHLPLDSAIAMRRASAVAAAHLACLPHFRSYALLACGGSSRHAGVDGSARTEHLLLCWRRAAPPPAGPTAYDGEFAGSLVFPACAAALQLQQWLLLRLGAAQALLGRLMPVEGGGSRAAKRQRLDGWPGQHGGVAGAVEQADSLAEAVLLECSSSLQTAQGALLAAAAGKLPLQDFLRLEAAAAAATSGGGGGDLLPPGAADPVFRLCCSLYLDPPAPAEAAAPDCGAAAGRQGGALEATALSSLVEPLTAAGELDSGPIAGRLQPGWTSGCEEEALDVVPDSEDEEAALAAAGAAAAAAPAAAQGWPAVAGPTGALASALGALLVEAASTLAEHGQALRPPAAAAAAVPTCQRAAAHMLRLLAGRGRGGPTPDRLLPALLAALVQQCRQQLAAQAEPTQPSAWVLSLGGQQGAMRLRFAEEGAAAAVQQQVAALACALLLELLPSRDVSASGASLVTQQQAWLAAVANVVQRALADGAAAGWLAAASLQQEFEAAVDAAWHAWRA